MVHCALVSTLSVKHLDTSFFVKLFLYYLHTVLQISNIGTRYMEVSSN